MPLKLSQCVSLSQSIYQRHSQLLSVNIWLLNFLSVCLGGYQYFLNSLYFMSHYLKVPLSVSLSEYLRLLNFLSVSYYLKVSLGVSQCIRISVFLKLYQIISPYLHDSLNVSRHFLEFLLLPFSISLGLSLDTDNISHCLFSISQCCVIFSIFQSLSQS